MSAYFFISLEASVELPINFEEQSIQGLYAKMWREPLTVKHNHTSLSEESLQFEIHHTKISILLYLRTSVPMDDNEKNKIDNSILYHNSFLKNLCDSAINKGKDYYFDYTDIDISSTYDNITSKSTQEGLESIYSKNILANAAIEPYPEAPLEEGNLKELLEEGTSFYRITAAGIKKSYIEPVDKWYAFTQDYIDRKVSSPLTVLDVSQIIHCRNTLVDLIDSKSLAYTEREAIHELILNRVALLKKLCKPSLTEENPTNQTFILRNLYNGISEITKYKLESTYSEGCMPYMDSSMWLHEDVIRKRIDTIFHPFISQIFFPILSIYMGD